VDLREALNKNPKASAAIGVVLVAAAVGWAVWALVIDSGAPPHDSKPKAWFTTDDGATWFADEAARSAPFKTADGKTAVKAVVYKCGHGKTFVAYLERQSPAAQQSAETPKGDKANPYATQMAYYKSGVQVKSPKKGDWVPMNDPEAAKILSPVCPEGATDSIEPVLP
jgi:hypothetical protein